MAIQLHLEKRVLSIPPTLQSLAKAASSRRAMQVQCQHQIAQLPLAYSQPPAIAVDEIVLQVMLSRYSEQLSFQPLDEMAYFFAYNTGRFLEPGYPPLYYSRQNHKLVTPNKSAVAGIGEAVAGFLAQRLYKCRMLARPNHDYPDIVMDDGQKTFFVEAKATTAPVSDLKKVIDDELARMVAYVSACQELDPRSIVGLLIGTALENDSLYHCCITEIRV